MSDGMILIDLATDMWFGLPGSELSLRMKGLACDFDSTLSQWLLDNVGALGDVWWVEVDKEADSLRAKFRDPSTETWVAMTWCDNTQEEP